MIFAESRADEDKMVNVTLQQMQDKLKQVLVIYEAKDEDSKESLKG